MRVRTGEVDVHHGKKSKHLCSFRGSRVPHQERSSPELLGLEVYPVPSKEAHAQTNAFSRVFPSQNLTGDVWGMEIRAGSLTDTLSLGVAPSTGSRGGRALAKRSRRVSGTNAEVAIPPPPAHSRLYSFLPLPQR